MPAHAKFDAFWFANFASIGLRPSYPIGQLAMRLLGIGAQLAPLIACAAIGWRWIAAPECARARVALGWLVAALGGFLAIGPFFDHYALPLVAPIAMLAAVALGLSTRLMVATLGLALALWLIEAAVRPDDASGARAVARVVAANDRGACPYVFIGDTITYRLGGCMPADRLRVPQLSRLHHRTRRDGDRRRRRRCGASSRRVRR